MINGCPKAFVSNMAKYAEPLSGTGRQGISAEVEKCVKDFYERCNNSCEAPGKNILMDHK